MLITAEHLDHWANSPDARHTLPALVRRLIWGSGLRITHLHMPSGSSTDRPGFDGIVEAGGAHPWVPEGRSVWELSCERQVGAKAKEDLAKRTRSTSPEERATTTFLFVTPRRWSEPAKEKFAEDCREAGWRAGRALDADDLVAWLGATPAVAVGFGEKLGRIGEGVESPERFFERWSRACEPAITASALVAGRFRPALALRRQIAPKRQKQAERVAILADSEEEAAAFAAAVLQRNPKLAAETLVVTDRPGWRFVEQNAGIRFVLCATGELAKHAIVREGLWVIVPESTGRRDLEFGTARTSDDPGNEGQGRSAPFLLPRLSAGAFADTLRKLGFRWEEAARLAERCGRSWSAFRRLRAKPGAAARPAWLERPEARSLSVLALFGSWHQELDQRIIAEVAQRPYEEIERELRILTDLSDAPVLELGGIWKAKAPLELFLLMAPRWTQGEIDRFLEQARAVLASPDDRYGSKHVRRALADGLARLAVLGPGLVKAGPVIEARVRRLVAELVEGADARRWQTVGPYLPLLAEAAPAEVLGAIEAAFPPSPSVTGGLAKSGGAGAPPRWLLPTLEILAWDVLNLPRAVAMSAQLQPRGVTSASERPPLEILHDIFRPWHPQTSAPLESRLEILVRLAERDPDLAFELCGRLLSPNDTHAWPRARPVWRDAWLPQGRVTSPEQGRALQWLADRALALAARDGTRLARLIPLADRLRDLGRDQALFRALADFAAANPPDADRAQVCTALTKKLCDSPPNEPALAPSAFRRLWRVLAPRDLVLRYASFFQVLWLDYLKERGSRPREVKVLRRWRRQAVGRILERRGIAGLFGLAHCCCNPALAGEATAHAGVCMDDLVSTAISSNRLGAGLSGPIGVFLTTALALAPMEKRRSAVRALFEHLESLQRPIRERGWFAALAIGDPALVAWFDALPEALRLEARLCRRPNKGEAMELWKQDRRIEFLLVSPEEIADPSLLLDALEELARSDIACEPKSLTEARISRIFVFLEEQSSVDRTRLAKIERALRPWIPDNYINSTWAIIEEASKDPAIFVEHLRRNDPTIEFFLQNCPRIPGQREDRTVDGKALQDFVDAVFALVAGDRKLALRAYFFLGCLLAGAPAEAGGHWPCEPVAALLDRPEAVVLHQGFETATVYAWREITEALQEDLKAAQRCAHGARRWAARYPRTAQFLHELAKGHLHQAGFARDLLAQRAEGLA